MTTIALLSQSFNLEFLAEPLMREAPHLKVLLQGDPGAHNAEVAVCWEHRPGALAEMPNLRLIHGIGAGVDNILSDRRLPELPVCRVVDPTLSSAMSDFVMWGVLHYHRQLDVVLANQTGRKWARPIQMHNAKRRVGILGLGEIGRHVAQEIARAGFTVRGWSRSQHTLPGVDTFSGESELPVFLRGTDILVCLLPLTEETRSILNRRTFAYLPRGAKLINVGRGEHLVDDDLADALKTGQLSGAIVDVFAVEPLPTDSSLWDLPNLIVTPHMASTPSKETISKQIAENARRLVAGQPLLNLVSPSRGY